MEDIPHARPQGSGDLRNPKNLRTHGIGNLGPWIGVGCAKIFVDRSMAVLKLAYLNMLGYDMSWASFQMVEVMSHNKFTTRRPGYLAHAGVDGKLFDVATENLRQAWLGKYLWIMDNGLPMEVHG